MKIHKIEQSYIDYDYGIRQILAMEDEITLTRFLLFAPEVDFDTLHYEFDISFIPTLDKVFRLVEGYVLKSLEGFKPDLLPASNVISRINLVFDSMNLGKPKLNYKDNIMVRGDEYIPYKCYKLISNILNKLLQDRNPAYKDVLVMLRNNSELDPNIFIVLAIDNKEHLNHEYIMNIFNYSGTSVESMLFFMKHVFEKKLHRKFDFTPYIERYISMKNTFLNDLLSTLERMTSRTSFRVASIFGRDVDNLVKQMLKIYLEGEAFSKCDKFLESLYNKYTDENRDIRELEAIERYRVELINLMDKGYMDNLRDRGVADSVVMYNASRDELYRNYEILMYSRRMVATNIDDLIVAIYMSSLFNIFTSDPNIKSEIDTTIALVADGLFDFNPNMLSTDKLKYYING